MKLVIITINYNSAANSIKLLESLKNQTSNNFEIIVVDNNSDDVEKLMDYQTSETNIIYIKNDRNLGYSGGNNVGIKKALENGADWVLLLNNDTWVESSFIEHLKANLGDKEGLPVQTGIVGLAIDEGSRSVLAGQIEWPKPTLLHLTTLKVVRSKSVDNLYVIGGAMAIHKDVFENIGFLDENYFLYFEDADLSQRAKKSKFSVKFQPFSTIWHKNAASTGGSGSKLQDYFITRNRLLFGFKYARLRTKIALLRQAFFSVNDPIKRKALFDFLILNFGRGSFLK